MSHGRACSLGSARGGVTSSPGTLESLSYPLSDRHPTNVPTASDRIPKEITGRRGESPISPSEPAREAKETRNQTAQMRAPLNETGEGEPAEEDEENKHGKEDMRRRSLTPDTSPKAMNVPTTRTIQFPISSWSYSHLCSGANPPRSSLYSLFAEKTATISAFRPPRSFSPKYSGKWRQCVAVWLAATPTEAKIHPPADQIQFVRSRKKIPLKWHFRQEFRLFRA